MNTPQNPQLYKHSVSNCCDCFVGFLSGEEVRKSELKQMVIDIVELQPQLKKIRNVKRRAKHCKTNS